MRLDSYEERGHGEGGYVRLTLVLESGEHREVVIQEDADSFDGLDIRVEAGKRASE